MCGSVALGMGYDVLVLVLVTITALAGVALTMGGSLAGFLNVANWRG